LLPKLLLVYTPQCYAAVQQAREEADQDLNGEATEQLEAEAFKPVSVYHTPLL